MLSRRDLRSFALSSNDDPQNGQGDLRRDHPNTGREAGRRDGGTAGATEATTWFPGSWGGGTYR